MSYTTHSDGHSGMQIQKQKEYSSKDFNFTSATLEHSSGAVDIVLHGSSNFIVSRHFQFLEEIGFSHFSGRCQFYSDSCLFRTIATISASSQRAFDPFGVQGSEGIYESIERFTEKIADLYSLHQKQNDILQWLGSQAHPPTIFAPPPTIIIEPSDIPSWTEEVKFDKLKELESQVRQANEEIQQLREYLPLLYASGDILVQAAIKALQYLGLKAQPTEKGYTVDILAQTEDEARKFGFEVTGTNGSIKKASKKVGQVFEFERIKESSQKTVLIANTHNETPILERQAQEDFTQNVVNLLTPHHILLMTGWNLYRMVQDVMGNVKNQEDIINILYSSAGILQYE